jgi:hypothetical protein
LIFGLNSRQILYIRSPTQQNLKKQMQRESSREETKKPYKGEEGARTIEYNKMQKWVCFKSLAYTYTRSPIQQSLKKPRNPFVRAWKWHIIVASLGDFFFKF